MNSILKYVSENVLKLFNIFKFITLINLLICFLVSFFFKDSKLDMGKLCYHGSIEELCILDIGKKRTV